jgi:tetratricopeptide (TPR) repeat protein
MSIPEPRDLPGRLAQALDLIDPLETPPARHEHSLDFIKLVIVHVCDVLDAEYAAHRDRQGPIDGVEKQLAELPGPRTLGTRWQLAWRIWQDLPEHALSSIRTAKDDGRMALAELQAVWDEFKRAWESKEDDAERAGLPYAHLAAKVQGKKAHTALGPALGTLINHRNVHAHASEGVRLIKGGLPRVLSFSDEYYAVVAPRLHEAALALVGTFFGPLSGRGLLTITSVDRRDGGHVFASTLDLGLGSARRQPEAPCTSDDLVADSRWLPDEQGRPRLRLLDAPLEALVPLVEESQLRPSTGGYRPPTSVFTVPFRSKQDHFVGRDDALAGLHEHLTSGRRTLIGQAASIHGMGGIGKTQLAVEYSHRYRTHYPDGVVWLDTTQRRQPALVEFAVEALGGRPDDKPENLAAIARDWLRRHHGYLLVLDNVEDDGALADWLPEGGDGDEGPSILATSRHRLGPEWSAVPLDKLARAASIELLRNVTGDADHTRCSDDEADELCSRLCDFPLAIEIAGAYLHRYGMVTAGEYLEELERSGVHRLSQDGDIGPTRHRACVVATLALNRERLADRPHVLRLVESMATWTQGRVDADLLRRAAGSDSNLAFKEALSDAWNLSLLQKGEDGDATRPVVRIHPFLQEVVREELDADVSAEHTVAWRRGARAWLAERRDSKYTERVQGHGKGLQQLCGGEGPNPEVACVLRELAHHAEIAGLGPEATELLEAALKRWPPDMPLDEAVRLSLVEAQVALFLGAPSAAFEHARLAEDALASRPADQRRLWAVTLALRAWAERDLGRLREAHETAERAYFFAEAHLADWPEAQARAYNDLGATLETLGRHREALPLARRALEINTRVLGADHPDLAGLHANLAGTLRKLGDAQASLEHGTAALSLAVAAFGPQHPVVAFAHTCYGTALHDMGRLPEALDHKQRALEIRKETLPEGHQLIAAALSNIGSTLASLGRHDEALDHTERSLKIYLSALDAGHPLVGRACHSLGCALFSLNRVDESWDRLKQAERILLDVSDFDHQFLDRVRRSLKTVAQARNKANPGFRQVSAKPGNKSRKPKKRKKNKKR